MDYIIKSYRLDWSGRSPVEEILWLREISGCMVFVKDRVAALRMTEEQAKVFAAKVNEKILKTDFGAAKLSAEPANPNLMD